MLPPFPSWAVAALVAAFGVYAVEQVSPRWAWWLALLIILGIAIRRGQDIARLDAFVAEVFGSGPAPPSGPTPARLQGNG